MPAPGQQPHRAVTREREEQSAGEGQACPGRGGARNGGRLDVTGTPSLTTQTAVHHRRGETLAPNPLLRPEDAVEVPETLCAGAYNADTPLSDGDLFSVQTAV